MLERLRHLFKSQYHREVRHPELGLLTLDVVWRGEVIREGQKIDFALDGTSAGPDSRLVNTLSGVINRFSELENIARAFIASRDPLIDVRAFEFRSVTLLWRRHPECFWFEYDLQGDEGALWRVEFEGDEPKYLSRDD